MNNPSWRHHYIPKFYLNGFTDKSGKFKIYDVENQRFIKNGKDFSPESYFFEEHGNTFINEEGYDDFIETKFFKKADDAAAKLFEKIRNSTQSDKYGVSEADMPSIQYFISVMHCRIPKNYEKVGNLLKTMTLREMGLVIRSNDDAQIAVNEIEKKLKEDPNFFKMFKYWLPLVTYPRLGDCRTPLTIKPFIMNLPSLCSDNPIIFKSSDLPDIYFDDLIFPLSNELLFIRGNNIKTVWNTIKIEIDLIVYKQANKYVSCTDIKYIERLDQYYQSDYSSLEQLKDKVFSQLIC
jgi:hypothetical protein